MLIYLPFFCFWLWLNGGAIETNIIVATFTIVSLRGHWDISLALLTHSSPLL